MTHGLVPTFQNNVFFFFKMFKSRAVSNPPMDTRFSASFNRYLSTKFFFNTPGDLKNKDSGQRVKNLKNRQVSTKSNSRISRISTGYQGLLYTGYHELSPLATSYSFCTIDFCSVFPYSQKKSRTFPFFPQRINNESLTFPGFSRFPIHWTASNNIPSVAQVLLSIFSNLHYLETERDATKEHEMKSVGT